MLENSSEGSKKSQLETELEQGGEVVDSTKTNESSKTSESFTNEALKRLDEVLRGHEQSDPSNSNNQEGVNRAESVARNNASQHSYTENLDKHPSATEDHNPQNAETLDEESQKELLRIANELKGADIEIRFDEPDDPLDSSA